MKADNRIDVLIVGGGLAGLCSATHLASKGLSVTLIEKDLYPRHRVCGEYVSNETLPYLSSLGIKPFREGAVAIDELEFSTPNGRSLRADLPLGGFGISRYRLDALIRDRALEKGANIVHGEVAGINFQPDGFVVKTKSGESYGSRFVIGAYGKRSALDKKLGRDFIERRSSYVAVKAHYEGAFPANRVGLYNFEGGYCGISNVEDNRLNICYISDYAVFRNYRTFEEFETQVLQRSPQIKKVLSASAMLFDRPLTISQISFDPKELIVDHVLMCGDSAGLIHPLCGNGMGMAVGGARLVSEAILSYFKGELNSREEVENAYRRMWSAMFSSRLRTGHILAAALRNNGLATMAMPILRNFPFVLQRIIRATHGKEIVAA